LMPLAAIGMKRSFVLGSATGFLLPVYARRGWERTGVVYGNPSLLGVTHEYIVLRVPAWAALRCEALPGSLGAVADVCGWRAHFASDEGAAQQGHAADRPQAAGG
jgi:hypothetical protein